MTPYFCMTSWVNPRRVWGELESFVPMPNAFLCATRCSFLPREVLWHSCNNECESTGGAGGNGCVADDWLERAESIRRARRSLGFSHSAFYPAHDLPWSERCPSFLSTEGGETDIPGGDVLEMCCRCAVEDLCELCGTLLEYGVWRARVTVYVLQCMLGRVAGCSHVAFYYTL